MSNINPNINPNISSNLNPNLNPNIGMAPHLNMNPNINPNMSYANANINNPNMPMMNPMINPMVNQNQPTTLEVETESISKTISSMPPNDLFDILGQLKLLVQKDPEQARQLLHANPQLSYTIMQIMLTLNLVRYEDVQVLLLPFIHLFNFDFKY